MDFMVLVIVWFVSPGFNVLSTAKDHLRMNTVMFKMFVLSQTEVWAANRVKQSIIYISIHISHAHKPAHYNRPEDWWSLKKTTKIKISNCVRSLHGDKRYQPR